MARRYLFVYDTRDRSFPERWVLPNNDDDTSRAPNEEVKGWISDGDAGFEARMGAFRAGYNDAHFEVREMHATSWKMVARNYAGMRR